PRGEPRAGSTGGAGAEPEVAAGSRAGSSGVPGLTCSASPGRLAVVAAAAALRGGVPLVLALPTDASATLRLPGLGTAVLPGHTELGFWSDGERAELRGGRHPVELPGRLRQPAPGWHPTPRVETAHRGSTLQVTLDSLDGDGCGELPLDWW